MANTNYIRPMSFLGMIGTMYRVYLRIMIPIIILNILVNYFTLSIGILIGIFVGPVLMMTSNAILGQRVKAWQSIKKGISPGLILKTAFVSFSYIALVFVVTVAIGLFAPNANTNSYFIWFISIYIALSPIWIFIPMIMLLEKIGLRASIKRSFQILRRNFLKILQMDIFITLILTVMAFAFAPFMGDPDPTANLGTGAIIALLLATITGFNALPYVFVYYEYRARHENYSEELLTQELGYQPIEEMLAV